MTIVELVEQISLFYSSSTIFIHPSIQGIAILSLEIVTHVSREIQISNCLCRFFRQKLVLLLNRNNRIEIDQDQCETN